MFIFGLTIFTGAFLLFLVQPLIGKFILPWFGGSPAVWTTCMLFFQLLLLGGYAYAHLSISKLKPRQQVILHLALLALALALLPITPSDQWKPADSTSPTWRILLLLGGTLGLPYLVLSATGPLMQAWFSQTQPHKSPYRLYALSNVGSFLALGSYPFLVEPNFARRAQAGWWSVGLVVFAVLAGWCGMMVWKRATQNEPANKTTVAVDGDPPRVSLSTRLLWFALPACGTVLLLAVTNKLCQDIAVIPFLWVLPLSLYLLSFIISFERELWYWRPVWLPLLALALGAVLWLMLGRSMPESQLWLLKRSADVKMFPEIGIYLAALLICCMVCHGEVFRLRPAPRQLTGYYLMISAGGACGGIFVAVIAPFIFKGFYELHVGLLAVALLIAVVLFLDGKSPLHKGKRVWAWALIVVALLGMGLGFYQDVPASKLFTVEQSRNFYGTLKVSEYNVDFPQWRKFALWHGATQHGFQFVDKVKSREPTSYYTAHSGIGLAMKYFPRQTERRVGVIGLGAGSLVVYGKKGDYYRLYEINDDVIRLAKARFTYLKDCEAKMDIVLGDARLSLEREENQNFDILILDAFSSDAIPTHLLTREAFEIYRRHLKPDGVIAVHISNRFLDLRPIVLLAADHFGFAPAIIDSRNWGLLDHDEDKRGGAFSSTWMLLTKNTTFLEQRPLVEASTMPQKYSPNIKMWTDDESNLLRIMILRSGWR